MKLLILSLTTKWNLTFSHNYCQTTLNNKMKDDFRTNTLILYIEREIVENSKCQS